MRHSQKKKEGHKGFDLLDAVYAEKGLISGEDSHFLASKAVGDTHAHSHRHLKHQKEKQERARFVVHHSKRENAKRAGFLRLAEPKPKDKSTKKPLQMKRKDIDPGSGEEK